MDKQRFSGPVYVRPLGRGICIPGDRDLADLLGDEGYFHVEITWVPITDRAEQHATERLLFPAMSRAAEP